MVIYGSISYLRMIRFTDFFPPAMNHFYCRSDKVDVSSTVQRGTLRGGTGSRKTSTSKNWPSWYSPTLTTWTTSTSSQTNVPSSKRRWSRSARSRSKVRIGWASPCGLLMITTAPSYSYSPTRAAYTISLCTLPDLQAVKLKLLWCSAQTVSTQRRLLQSQPARAAPAAPVSSVVLN